MNNIIKIVLSLFRLLSITFVLLLLKVQLIYYFKYINCKINDLHFTNLICKVKTSCIACSSISVLAMVSTICIDGCWVVRFCKGRYDRPGTIACSSRRHCTEAATPTLTSVEIFCIARPIRRRHKNIKYESISKAMKRNYMSSWRLIGVRGSKRFFISEGTSWHRGIKINGHFLVVVDVGHPQQYEVVIYDVLLTRGCSNTTWILNKKQLDYNLIVIEEYFYNSATRKIVQNKSGCEEHRERVMFSRNATRTSADQAQVRHAQRDLSKQTRLRLRRKCSRRKAAVKR